jgi:uncharacterized coiled-coil protein SlyX
MTDDTQKQVAETVARLRPHAGNMGLAPYQSMRQEAADLLETLAARMAEVEAELGELKRHLDAAEKTRDTYRAACNNNLALQKEATARVTELEALLATYQDQTVPDLTAVYIAGGMDRRDEVARLREDLSGAYPRYQHVKRGTIYQEFGRGQIQTDTPLTDYAEVVIYRGEHDGRFWVRPVSEFDDGRFAALAAPQPTATKETKDE